MTAVTALTTPLIASAITARVGLKWYPPAIVIIIIIIATVAVGSRPGKCTPHRISPCTTQFTSHLFPPWHQISVKVERRPSHRSRTSRQPSKLLSSALSLRSTVSTIFSLRSSNQTQKKPRVQLLDFPLELLERHSWQP